MRAEIEHARAYVQIQNMRYENAIELIVEIEYGRRDLSKAPRCPLGCVTFQGDTQGGTSMLLEGPSSIPSQRPL